MSTNYYLVNKEQAEAVHIGKSSMGWKFLFNVGYRGHADELNSFEKWMDHLQDCTRSGWVILDEYDRPMEYTELRKYIIEKQCDGMDYWHPNARAMLPNCMDKTHLGDSGERYCPRGFRFSTAAEFC